MARWRQAVELAMTDEDIEKLTAIARSRSKRRVGWSERRYCLRTVRNPRSSLSGKDSVFIIRRFNAVWSGRWPMAH